MRISIAWFGTFAAQLRGSADVEPKTCPEIVPGLYSATRPEGYVSLQVLNTTNFVLTASSLGTESSSTVGSALGGGFKFHLETDCSIQILNPCPVLAAVTELIPGIRPPFAYLPRVSGIQWGEVFLSLNVPTREPIRLSAFRDVYFRKHISGVTLVLRIISNEDLLLAVVLPVASGRNREVMTSVVLSYELDDNKIAVFRKPSTDMSAFVLINSVFAKIAEVSTHQALFFDFEPEAYTLNVGTLSLEVEPGILDDLLSAEAFDDMESSMQDISISDV